MTIAVALKVGDGVVLGADSASTLTGPSGVVNVYFNAEKIVNIDKRLPMGMATYGLGGLAGRSSTNLAKDLRQRFTGATSNVAWELDPQNYTIEDVAKRVREFFYDELYTKEYPKTKKDDAGNQITYYDAMGFLVAGFSADVPHAEVWTVDITEQGKCEGPNPSIPRTESAGAHVQGQPEAVLRLLNGWSPAVLSGLMRSGISEADAERFLRSLPVEPLIAPAMPIQDAIDLVHYMCDVTCGFVKFTPGPPSVAPPIDIAAITRHEGFRWVRRKHYFPPELNPVVN